MPIICYFVIFCNDICSLCMTAQFKRYLDSYNDIGGIFFYGVLAGIRLKDYLYV